MTQLTVRAGYDRRWWTLAVLCTSLVLITVDPTILNVAIPTLSRLLATTTGELQWIVDAYTVVFAGLLLAAVVWRLLPGGVALATPAVASAASEHESEEAA
jgi:hypothetical protein